MLPKEQFKTPHKKIIIVVGSLCFVLFGYIAYAIYDKTIDCDDSLCQIDEAELALLASDVVTLPEIEGPRGSFEAYSPLRLSEITSGKILIFFHASWCPSCRALSADIERNAGAIPADVTILKADFDTETALKEQYGVTSQHTVVQIDVNNNIIKKWSGGSRLEAVLLEIQ